MRTTTMSAITAVTAASLLVAGCSSKTATPGAGPPTASAGGTTVAIKNFKFMPTPLHVKVGASVTWTNTDASTHTVTDSGKFGSAYLPTGKTFTFKFTTPGTYSYICTIHQFMNGQVIVS